MSGNGVSCVAQGSNDAQVTVTVSSGLVGDVVLYAFYTDAANQLIQVTGQLVVSQGPTGASMTGIGILPWDPTLPVGSEITIQVAALYSDGTSSLRYVGTNAITATSSDASVVSVTNPLLWQLQSAGSAQVIVNWSGFSATNDVTAFISPSDLPALSITDTGGSITLAWPLWAAGFTPQSSPHLPTTNWEAIDQQASTNGQEINLTLPDPQGAAFYRLAR
jgi:hypothetical protein